MLTILPMQCTILPIAHNPLPPCAVDIRGAASSSDLTAEIAGAGTRPLVSCCCPAAETERNQASSSELQAQMPSHNVTGLKPLTLVFLT